MAEAGVTPGTRRKVVASVALASAVGVIGIFAGTAGGAPTPTGGLAPPDSPEIRDAVCLSECVGLRAATAGSLVQVTGSGLSSVDRMTFEGADGRIVAPVKSPTETAATAKVPKGALTGRVLVLDMFGNRSRLSPEDLEIRPVSELGSAGTLSLTEAETTPEKAYFFGVQAPRLTYIISSSQKLNDLRIDVVDAGGGIVRSYFRSDVPASAPQTVRWDGNTSAGKPAPNGSYSFRVSSQSGLRAKVAAGARRGGLAFKLYGFIFPLRAPHTYGDGIGAPRAGHTHQGLDVLSKCGPPLVAARGGRVQYSGYQGAAGNYIVIDGRATGQDYVYMHMIAPSPLKEGQVVKTGQVIGHVGTTGSSTACHLHFEIWSAPGWYEGGTFLDPVPSMKKWDRYS